MPRIFISYRRNDAAFIAPVLAQRLRAAYGDDAVFIDIDTIPFGTDFRDHIGSAVDRCDVLIALIGKAWAGAEPGGGRRIDDPADIFRIEIEAAIQRGIPVVPVLLDGARIPPVTELPETLAPLAFRNAAELRAGRDMDHHLARIVSGVRPLLGLGEPNPAEGEPSSPVQPATVAPPSPPPMQSAAGASRLRFERDRGWGGRAVPMRILVDGQAIGSLRAGESLEHAVDPGLHRVEVRHAGALSNFSENVQVAPGEERAWVLSFAWTGAVNLTER